MLISESKLRKIIRAALVQEQWEKASGLGGSSTPQLTIDHLHTALAAVSLADPTMVTDLVDAFIYSLQGDHASAALVIAGSAAGLGAGAAIAKVARARKAAKAAKGDVPADDMARLNRAIDDAEVRAREAGSRKIKAPPARPGRGHYVNPGRGQRVTNSGDLADAAPGTPRGQGPGRGSSSDPRAARHISSIASRVPWAEKKLWILRGANNADGSHQIVALKNNQGQTFLFYKSSGTNTDEFGNVTRNWLRFHGFSPRQSTQGPFMWFIKDTPGTKANPPGLQPLADQINSLDDAIEGPGLSFIAKYIPGFKIESISYDITQEGISDIAKFNQWAESIGALTDYARTKHLPGINFTMADAIDFLGL